MAEFLDFLFFCFATAEVRLEEVDRCDSTSCSSQNILPLLKMALGFLAFTLSLFISVDNLLSLTAFLIVVVNDFSLDMLSFLAAASRTAVAALATAVAAA